MCAKGNPYTATMKQDADWRIGWIKDGFPVWPLTEKVAEKPFFRPELSFPRKRESSLLNTFWTPAFAGVTTQWSFSGSR
jgi:hypothetical protein